MGLPYLFVLQRRVDGNKSKVGFEKYHHAWKSFTFTVWFIEVSCSLLFSWNYWSVFPKTHQNAIANRPNLNSRGLVNRKFGKRSGKSDMGSLESQWSWKCETTESEVEYSRRGGMTRNEVGRVDGISQVGKAAVCMKNPQFWQLEHRTKSLPRAKQTSSLHCLCLSCL